MKSITSLFAFSVFAATSLLFASCASSSSEKSSADKKEKGYKDREYAANPPVIKFGEFTKAELKETTLAPKHRDKKANRQSADMIDGMLLASLKNLWPNLTVIPEEGAFSNGAERTLQITPIITDIKLVSVGARVMWGVMAGGSDIVMHVEYRDSSTGELIANPDFWRGNNAWSGGSTWGAADNQIRDAVVAQIVSYTAGNK